MKQNRTDRKIYLSILAVTLLAFLAGCSGTRGTIESEDDFFLPFDTAKGDKGVMANIPPSVVIPEGLPQQIGGEFEAPLTEDEVPIIYNITPQALRDSLSLINEHISYLQTILEASTIDPRMYYHSQVKAWRITNPVLRDSLFYALLAIDSSLETESGTDAEVLATETNDLIEVRFGTSIFKGLALKDAVDKSSDRFLYRKIVQSGDYSKDIELRDTNFAIPTPFKPELLDFDRLNEKFLFLGTKPAARAMYDLSFYGFNFKVGQNWGGTFKVGTDELSLPFWTAGTASFLASYKGLKVGFQLPVRWGRTGGDKFPLFTVRNRILNGSRGLTAEFDVGNFGGYFSSTKVTNSDINTLNNFKNFYSITQDLLAYYSFGFSVDKSNFMRIKIGGSSYKVQQASLVPPTEDGAFVKIDESIFNTVYFKVDYLHDAVTERFGGSLQYLDLSLLSSAWLDIIPHKLRLELKYAKVVSRAVRPWELPDFVILSPRWFLEF